MEDTGRQYIKQGERGLDEILQGSPRVVRVCIPQ